LGHRIGTALPLNNNNERSERLIVKTNECFPTIRFLIITFIGQHKNDSNTQRFKMNKNTFIDNESFNGLRNV